MPRSRKNEGEKDADIFENMSASHFLSPGQRRVRPGWARFNSRLLTPFDFIRPTPLTCAGIPSGPPDCREVGLRTDHSQVGIQAMKLAPLLLQFGVRKTLTQLPITQASEGDCIDVYPLTLNELLHELVEGVRWFMIHMRFESRHRDAQDWATKLPQVISGIERPMAEFDDVVSDSMPARLLEEPELRGRVEALHKTEVGRRTVCPHNLEVSRSPNSFRNYSDAGDPNANFLRCLWMQLQKREHKREVTTA